MVMTVESKSVLGARNSQQDAYFSVETEHGVVMAVADGHGDNGEVAAQAALDIVAGQMNLPDFYNPGGVANPISTGAERRVDISSTSHKLGLYWNNDLQ